MKRILITVFAAVIAAANVNAQFKSTYFTAEEMPDGVVFLPSPPDTTSIQFISDYSQYMWGKTIPTLRLSAVHPKETYMRKRPFVRMNETTPVPQEEEELRNSGSYPSGHAIRGWGMALLLAEINPAAQDALLKLGYEWGESRVILGYHWQTDMPPSHWPQPATPVCTPARNF